MTLRRTMGLAALALGLVVTSSPARAQTEAELDRARATFAEGVELTQQEQWTEAAARFREVLAVRSTPQVQFNLGLALAQSGEIVEAIDLLTAAVESGELDRRTRRTAQRELARIEPLVGTLTVTLTGDREGVSVTLDGDALTTFGEPVRASEGAHALAARRGAETVAEARVEVQGGEDTAASLDVGAAPIPAPALRVEPDDVGEPTPWWVWVAAAAVGVVVIGGIVLGVVLAGDARQPFSGNLEPGMLEVMP